MLDCAKAKQGQEIYAQSTIQPLTANLRAKGGACFGSVEATYKLRFNSLLILHRTFR